MKSRAILAAAVAASFGAGLAAPRAVAQSSEIFCLTSTCTPPRALTNDEKAGVKDAFFQLVLRTRPDVVALAEIEELIKGSTGRHRFFVVHEEIKDPAPTPGARRRGVVTFTGLNQQAGRPPISLANVMLSFSFSPSQLPAQQDIEAVAFDAENAVFNFYRLDEARPAGAAPAPPGTLSWKLAATSSDLGVLSPAERTGGCLGCHTSGTPIMKELRSPWSNWHAPRSRAGYLEPSAPAAGRWPAVAATDPHFSNLQTSDTLEIAVVGAITRFGNARFERTIRPDGQGGFVVHDAKQALRPLFETTEINLASAFQESNLHPLSGVAQTQPSDPVAIPNGFFVASPTTFDKVGISEALEFKTRTAVEPERYKALVQAKDLKIKPESGPAMRGDAPFAWLTPELGFAAVHWIEKLLDGKVLSKPFIAAVLGADLEQPIFSEARAKLLDFVPASFTAMPGEPHPDALTRSVIAALQSANPPAGSVEAEFLATLQAADPVGAVRARVIAYRDRIAGHLAAGPAARDGEMQRLFDLLIERRQAFKDHPVFCHLIESQALLPLPDPETKSKIAGCL